MLPFLSISVSLIPFLKLGQGGQGGQGGEGKYKWHSC